MSGQHFSASIYIGDYLVTGQTSDLQFEITELNDDKMVVHRNLSGDLDEIETRKENELMAVEAKFDINEPLDDVPSDIEEGEEANVEKGDLLLLKFYYEDIGYLLKFAYICKKFTTHDQQYSLQLVIIYNPSSKQSK